MDSAKLLMYIVTDSDTGTVPLPPEGDLAVRGLQQVCWVGISARFVIRNFSLSTLSSSQDRGRSGSPDIRREIRPKYVDHDNQMRLVTEQVQTTGGLAVKKTHSQSNGSRLKTHKASVILRTVHLMISVQKLCLYSYMTRKPAGASVSPKH